MARLGRPDAVVAALLRARRACAAPCRARPDATVDLHDRDRNPALDRSVKRCAVQRALVGALVAEELLELGDQLVARRQVADRANGSSAGSACSHAASSWRSMAACSGFWAISSSSRARVAAARRRQVAERQRQVADPGQRLDQRQAAGRERHRGRQVVGDLRPQAEGRDAPARGSPARWRPGCRRGSRATPAGSRRSARLRRRRGARHAGRPGVGRGERVGAEADAHAHAEVERQGHDLVGEPVPQAVGLGADQQQQLVAVDVGGGPQLDLGQVSPQDAVVQVDDGPAGPVVEQVVGREPGDRDRVELRRRAPRPPRRRPGRRRSSPRARARAPARRGRVVRSARRAPCAPLVG